MENENENENKDDPEKEKVFRGMINFVKI